MDNQTSISEQLNNQTSTSEKLDSADTNENNNEPSVEVDDASNNQQNLDNETSNNQQSVDNETSVNQPDNEAPVIDQPNNDAENAQEWFVCVYTFIYRVNNIKRQVTW